MKKKLVMLVTVVAVLCLSVVMVSGCSNGGQKTAEKTSITLGFDNGYPPYGFIGDDGEYTGFDIDLAKAVCEKKGWDLKLEAIDWAAKDDLMNSGSINCIWNGFTYEGREDLYAWTEPYMLNEQVIVVKADSGIATEADLAGKVVMTQTDSAALGVLEGDKAELAATFKELQTIGDYNNAFMQLESGLVDAVACDLSIADYQMTAKPNIYKNIVTLSSEHYAVAFKKGNEKTAETVTAALKELDKDGTVKSLCEKYSDYGMSYENWVLK